jgi:25S rRNA (uracil2843-N3)-methyltransferase
MLRMALADAMNAQDFMSRLQEIKKYFFERDYMAIFSEPNYLPVYAASYIPGRALCYYRILTRHAILLSLLAKSTNIYALGAGAGSELVAFMAATVHVMDRNEQGKHISTDDTESRVHLHVQDIADWSQVLQWIEGAARKKWGLSSSHITCEFSQGNILDLVENKKETSDKTVDAKKICHAFAQADLITVMFVLNELFTEKRQAMKFVAALVKYMKSGAYLLVR